tara:strand:+ start:96 stop:689 length:594 start_codon:yes stop_codon:yes gene_type:complete
MAVTNGINIHCSDLSTIGGIRTILVRTWAASDSITYSNSASTHSISSIQAAGSDATWFVYEFKNELPSLAVTAARENGSTSYECSLNFMMPEMDNQKGAVLQAMMDTCMMVIAVGNNGKSYVLGVSQKYENENTDGAVRNQTFASMTGAEGTSGAAYDDDSGWTVTLSCKQWEAPRLYEPSGLGITYYVTNDTCTTT